MSLRPLAIAITATVLLFSAGCSILPESDPATLYRLPSAEFVNSLPSSSASSEQPRLGIATPEAGYLLSGNRIVVYPERNVVNVYEGARWHEDTPTLIQNRLVDGLQQSRLFTSVGSDHLPADLLLLSELRHFQSEYQNGQPNAVIQLDVQLVDASTQTPLAARSFRASEPASDTAIPAVIDAFGRASDTLTEQLTAWLAEQSRVLKGR